MNDGDKEDAYLDPRGSSAIIRVISVKATLRSVLTYSTSKVLFWALYHGPPSMEASGCRSASITIFFLPSWVVEKKGGGGRMRKREGEEGDRERSTVAAAQGALLGHAPVWSETRE